LTLRYFTDKDFAILSECHDGGGGAGTFGISYDGRFATLKY
jgi:hypothetical protein